MFSIFKTDKHHFLPNSYQTAHNLCFLIHDIMGQLLKSGEEGNFFQTSLVLADDTEQHSLEEAIDIFDWLEQNNRLEDRAKILMTTVLPAVLSDMLHCIYEALETSRKGKLNISYMLIRKPIQESLFLLESIILNQADFAEKLATDPLKLRPSTVGGNHTERVQSVLKIIGEEHRLSASYLAKLRYDKSDNDSFDGICNHAMHLFTEHKAIKTEPMNINFIFSDWDSKLSQWSYLYSRLPYLLFYIHRIIEYITSHIAPTHTGYINDMERRISASILLWWDTIEDEYITEELKKFVEKTQDWLINHCQNAGYRLPNNKDLLDMSQSGRYPNESIAKLKIRNLRYKIIAIKNRIHTS